MASIRTAIIGTGMSLTVFHHPLITALPDMYTLHTVLERSASGRARSTVDESVKLVKTLEEVLQDQEVDLVVVSMPNKTHFEYCKMALEHGKHGEPHFTFYQRGPIGSLRWCAETD